MTQNPGVTQSNTLVSQTKEIIDTYLHSIYILSNNSALVSYLSYLLVNATLSPCFGWRNNVKTSGISSTVMLDLSL